MSAMNSLVFQIQNEILRGELSFAEIARAFSVPMSWVDEACQDLAEQSFDDDMPENKVNYDYSDYSDYSDCALFID